MPGLLNPLDSQRTTATRPAHVNSGTGNRRWYSDILRTRPKAQDLNAILSQLRNLFDFYGTVDTEGDDDALRKTIQAAAPTTLTADTTIYVRTDGNDANDGSSDDSGHAFLTIQAGINKAYTYNLNNKLLTIKVGDGTYTSGVTITTAFSRGHARLLGNTGTPGNCTISTTGDCISASREGTVLSVAGFKLTSSAGNCLNVASGAMILVDGASEVGTAAEVHALVSYGAVIQFGATVTISAGAKSFIRGHGGLARVVTGTSLVLAGTPAFSVAFIHLLQCSLLGNSTGDSPPAANPWAITGAATGKRFVVDHSSAFRVPAATNLNTYLPGDTYGDDGFPPLDEIGLNSSGTGLDELDLVRHSDLGRAAYLDVADIIGHGILSIAGATTLTIGDHGKSIVCTATLTITLPVQAQLNAEWFVRIKARSGVTVTVSAAGSDTIDGAASITIAATTGGTVRVSGAGGFEAFI